MPASSNIPRNTTHGAEVWHGAHRSGQVNSMVHSSPYQCSSCLDYLSPTSSPGELCPNCGSSTRTIHVSVEENIGVHCHLGALVADADGSHKGFSESERLDGVATGATLDSKTVSQHAFGPGSFNETDARETCARLVTFLNRGGADWQAPEDGRADIDWVSFDSTRKQSLNMQVVRTPAEPTVWRELSKQRSISTNLDLDQAAKQLWSSIEKKSKVPSHQRSTMTLVLDANRTPGLALSPVVDEFRRTHGSNAIALGFLDIFVVGPDDQLVSSLHPHGDNRQRTVSP